MKSSLSIPTHWTFRSSKVARHFDEHVREQLPWYDLATDAVGNFGRHYIPRGGQVYDIGASTGNIGLALLDTLNQRNARFVAIEEMAASIHYVSENASVSASMRTFSASVTRTW